MEIEVGKYIRTKTGRITKIKTINNVRYTSWGTKGKPQLKGTYRFLINGRYELEDIKKCEEDLIYLIEECDYVNGKRVIYVASIENKDDEEELCVFVEETQDCIEAKDIKSIVTKEQFKNIEYRLE